VQGSYTQIHLQVAVCSLNSYGEQTECLQEPLFNKSNLSRMDIDPKRISQGDGSEQRLPKT
jgi:hypothetical protein